MIKRLIQAYKLVKSQEKKTNSDNAVDLLLNDPLQLESIARIAKNCGKCFEIVRPSDGITLRFYENGFYPAKKEDNRDAW
jgi:hypothetical protein